MTFKREISGDINISIDDEGQMTIYSRHAEAEILLTREEFEEIEFSYEDWEFTPTEDGSR